MLHRVLGKLVLACAGIVLSASTAFAGVTTAKIAQLLVYEDGPLVYVYPVGGVQGAPSCHGVNGSYYSFSLNRPFAKEYLATLLAAQASGATVLFYGTGTCRDQGYSETLLYLSVYSN